MNENDSKHFSTTRDVAKTAVLAYIAVKVFKAGSHAVGDAVCFVKARKDAKSEK